LLFAFRLAFDRLLEFLLVVSFIRFFSFPFLFGYQLCVFNALIKGEIECLCGSWTGGWWLPVVMSD
jgi:hypothetical protein